jgi:hypothetical protein
LDVAATAEVVAVIGPRLVAELLADPVRPVIDEVEKPAIVGLERVELSVG